MTGHPPYLPPAFVDDLYLREVEVRLEDATEHLAVVEMESGFVPEYLHDLLLGDVPALIAELRRLADKRDGRT